MSGRVALEVTCLLMAASLTAYRKALEPVSRRSQAVFRHFAQGKHRRYRLTAFTLQMIKDKYVDPTRLRPRGRMLSGVGG